MSARRPSVPWARRRAAGAVLRAELLLDRARARLLPPAEELPPADGMIDAEALAAELGVAGAAASAERYFAATDRELALAKPFAAIEEAPELLRMLSGLLEGLQLRPPMRVLDFGCGTGWIGHGLTQLGADVVLADVSATALDLARERYRRQPPFGARPEPTFLQLDGTTIPLPDATVDRVVCLDALHHIPNRPAMLAELARVLRPDGVAAFSEPGPHHAARPQSQWEMRNFAAVERDIRLPEIWDEARAAGFRRIEVGIQALAPYRTSLAAFEAFVAGGAGTADVVRKIRDGHANHRLFFLFRDARPAARDARARPDLRAAIEAPTELRASAGGELRLDIVATNSGGQPWPPLTTGTGGVQVGAHLLAEDGTMLDFEFARAAFSGGHAIAPGARGTATMVATAPAEPGRYVLELDLVAEGVTWFALGGSPTARVALDVTG